MARLGRTPDGPTPAGAAPVSDAVAPAPAVARPRATDGPDHQRAFLRRLPTDRSRQDFVRRLGQRCGNRQLQRVLAPLAATPAVADRPPAGPAPDQRARGARGGAAIQRHAFVNEKQIVTSAAGFTPAMDAFLADPVVRNYTSVAEFEKHAASATDYLGNLADGTWLRFSPTGLNLLGEMHTLVRFRHVAAAVGTTNFIDERLSADDLAARPGMKAAYETENQATFKEFGIDAVKDKRPFGAESLFPKIGFVMEVLLPYLDGAKPMSELGHTDYAGQPVQRYLKIAWGHSKDNVQAVDQLRKAKRAIPPKLEALATVHAAVAGKLDAFITGLVVDGHLGDELVKKANAPLLAPLKQFAAAASEAMLEMATTDPSSRLTKAERVKLAAAKSVSAADKLKLFSRWRNFHFEDNVKAAAKRGVRYAGMGQAHLTHLVDVGLEKGMHPFEMAGKDLEAFEQLTEKLKKAARPLAPAKKP